MLEEGFKPRHLLVFTALNCHASLPLKTIYLSTQFFKNEFIVTAGSPWHPCSIPPHTSPPAIWHFTLSPVFLYCYTQVCICKSCLVWFGNP